MAAHTNGVRLVDDDSLAALAAELTGRLGGGDVAGERRHDLRAGRTYLVTGCAGFIGSHLTQALTLAAARSSASTPSPTTTRARARSATSSSAAATATSGFTERDVAEAPLSRCSTGVDGVFHLAGRPGVRTSWGSTFAAYLHDNVLATQRVFEAAVQHGDQGRLRLLVIGLRRRRATPCGRTPRCCPSRPTASRSWPARRWRARTRCPRPGRHRAALLLRLRAPATAGHGVLAVLGCLARQPSIRLLGSGRQTRDFTYVGDVVSATLARWSVHHPVASTTSAAAARPRCSARLRCVRSSRAAGSTRRHIPSAVGDARRTIADPARRAPSSAGRPPCRWSAACRADHGSGSTGVRADSANRSPSDGGMGGRLSSATASGPGGTGLYAALAIQTFRPRMGGAELQLERLLPHLAERGVRTEVLTRAFEGTPRRRAVAGLGRAPHSGRAESRRSRRSSTSPAHWPTSSGAVPRSTSFMPTARCRRHDRAGRRACSGCPAWSPCSAPATAGDLPASRESRWAQSGRGCCSARHGSPP